MWLCKIVIMDLRVMDLGMKRWDTVFYRCNLWYRSDFFGVPSYNTVPGTGTLPVLTITSFRKLVVGAPCFHPLSPLRDLN